MQKSSRVKNLIYRQLMSSPMPGSWQYGTLLEKMAHFSSVVTYGAGRSSQWAKPFVIFSSPGKGKLSAILIHAQEQCCHDKFLPQIQCFGSGPDPAKKV
jgi:hypothetical protein